MAEILTPEICVIGGGAGGRAAAMAAAGQGARTVLVAEPRSGALGRDAPLSMAALVAAARQVQAIREAGGFGVAPTEARVEPRTVRDRLGAVLAAAAPNDTPERLAALGVRIVEAVATFKDRRTLAAGPFEIKARRFVIATGAVPAPPLIEGLEAVGYLTARSALEFGVLPSHLVVAGASYPELAQAYRRLGAEVTWLDDGAWLEGEDSECAALLRDRLEREGIRIHTHVTLASVRPRGDGVVVNVRAEGKIRGIEASHLLVAAMRPNLDSLALDRAGILHDRNGIVVNAGLRTSNPQVYAIGDAVAGPPSAHRARSHAAVVVQNALFRRNLHADEDAIPRVRATDPELAQVGQTEAMARSRKIGIRVARWPYGENARARAERRTSGHVKIVTDKAGTVLGATILGAEAAEAIALWTLAVRLKLNISEIADLAIPSRAYAEIGQSAALGAERTRLTGGWSRRIMKAMPRFG